MRGNVPIDVGESLILPAARKFGCIPPSVGNTGGVVYFRVFLHRDIIHIATLIFLDFSGRKEADTEGKMCTAGYTNITSS